MNVDKSVRVWIIWKQCEKPTFCLVSWKPEAPKLVRVFKGFLIRCFLPKLAATGHKLVGELDIELSLSCILVEGAGRCEEGLICRQSRFL